MGEIAENSQWYKGKQPIIEEYSNQHRALLSTVASRNFVRPPGYLMEASIVLEEAGKNKLSALNYQIVSDAVERSLKQTGHGYSMTYKAARIAFELEKQTLLTALQQEFADLDATQSFKKEELNRLFVELDLRRIILITTKTTIELEMEGLKQELVDIDRLTFTNETLLINEKVITATAKLAVIPHLEALIEAQGKILIAEEANLPYMEDLIDEKELLISKKEELLPYIADKADARITLANKKEEMLPYISNKATAQSSLADKKQEILSYIESKIDAQVELSGVKTELLSYIEDKIDAKIALINKKEEILPYMEDKALAREQLTFKKEEMLPYMEDKATSIIELAAKRTELLPYISDKAQALGGLAVAFLNSISQRQSILYTEYETALLRISLADGTLTLINAEAELVSLRANLIAARASYQAAKITGQASITEARGTDTTKISTSHAAMVNAVTANDSTIISGNQSTYAGVSTNRETGQSTAVGLTTGAETISIRGIATQNAAKLAGVASAQATASITADLIHLIGE